MRTPEEIVELFNHSVSYEHDIFIIKNAQKEAWNEAVKAAADNVLPKYIVTNGGYDEIIGVDEESILKLKK